MIYKVENHLLSGPDIDFIKSPNVGSKFNLKEMDTIIIHFTAGSSRLSSVNSLCNPNSKASAHIVIGRDRKITQLIPFDTIAWHAGVSSMGKRSGFNKFSIGIEIDNAGFLQKHGDLYSSWFGKDYKIDEVIHAKHRNQNTLAFWHKYTEWQIEVCFEICELLIQSYNIKHIYGHEEISPSRKIDPGPAFPLDKLRERLLTKGRDENGPDKLKANETVFVSIDGLNIREQPDPESDKVAAPLKENQALTILETSDNWIKVKTEVIGWVNKKYVKK